MLARVKALREAGVLGINARNRDFVMAHNPRHAYPLVDNKLQSKKLAQAAGIAVPELYGAIHTNHELQDIPAILDAHPSCVIKPAHGSGGNGVLVLTGKRKNRYTKPNGLTLDIADVEYHASNILSGVFSLGSVPDTAMIEYRVRQDPVFEAMSYQGVPDIRLLVYRGLPAMAMLRLPTRSSDGKANLHQGAIGVGIDIVQGITTHGVQQNRVIDEHPDLGVELHGIAVPNWRQLLELGASCYELTGLGYLGVDIVLDKQFGPLILEINARPGLGIQIANQRGLETVFTELDQVPSEGMTPTARVELLLNTLAQQA
ncbi:MAG: alpha-L-glutamate ligase-like protein [Pseudomonadales bacterium]|nr:alpha-L-glutamate ligase-like protein [Pseudomonadales bacterium]